MHDPLGKGLRWWRNLSGSWSLELQRLRGANTDAQTATDATHCINYAYTLWYRERPELAPLQAISTTGAHRCIHDSHETRARDCSWHTELSDIPQHAAAAGTAVADVVMPILKIPWRMH